MRTFSHWKKLRKLRCVLYTESFVFRLVSDGDFTVTNHQRNPLEEIIVSWIARALSEISKRWSCQLFWIVPKTWFLTLVLQSDILCFRLPFFFLKCSLKIGVRIIHGHALYTGKHGNLLRNHLWYSYQKMLVKMFFSHSYWYFPREHAFFTGS